MTIQCLKTLKNRNVLSPAYSMLINFPSKVMFFLHKRNWDIEQVYNTSPSGVYMTKNALGLYSALKIVKDDKIAYVIYDTIAKALKELIKTKPENNKIYINTQTVFDSLEYIARKYNYEEIKYLRKCVKEHKQNMFIDIEFIINNVENLTYSYSQYEYVVALRELYYGSEYNFRIVKREIIGSLKIIEQLFYNICDEKYKKYVDAVIYLLKKEISNIENEIKRNSGYELYLEMIYSQYDTIKNITELFSYIDSQIELQLEWILRNALKDEEIMKIFFALKQIYKKINKHLVFKRPELLYLTTEEYNPVLSIRISGRIQDEIKIRIIKPVQEKYEERYDRLLQPDTTNIGCIYHFIKFLLTGDLFGGSLDSLKDIIKNKTIKTAISKRIKDYYKEDNSVEIILQDIYEIRTSFIIKQLDTVLFRFEYHYIEDDFYFEFHREKIDKIVRLFVDNEYAKYLTEMALECFKKFLNVNL